MDKLLELRAKDSAAVTADATYPAAALYIPGGTKHARMWLNLVVQSGAVSASTGTAVFHVKASAHGAGSYSAVTPTKSVALTTTATAAVQMFSLPVETPLEDFLLDLDITGTDATITFFAWLSPVREHG